VTFHLVSIIWFKHQLKSKRRFQISVLYVLA